MTKPKICIIGAGLSGIVMCKYLLENNFSFDCYEKGDLIGGLWNIKNGKEISAAYESLHINTSKKVTAFEDFPFPDEYPDFPSHFQITKYLNDYCHQNNIQNHIAFGKNVVSVKPLHDGKFIVTLEGGASIIYDYVIVATGHHWKPNIPSIFSDFEGKFLHSKNYYNTKDFHNKKILVVGMGNSAVDIACELSRIESNTVEISTRSSAYIFPHYFLGKPLGELASLKPFPWPKTIKRFLGHIILWLAVGNQQSYGIPKPKHKLLEGHSTVSSDIFPLLGKGLLKIRNGIQSIKGRKVIFNNGEEKEFDVIIASTGYNISLPFLSDKILNTEVLERNNRLLLYKRIVHTEYPHLFFLGFIQPNYSVFRTVEEQAKWIIHLLKKDFYLPDKNNMNIEIDKHLNFLKDNFYQSKRHTIQVDFSKYLKDLQGDYL